MDRRIFLKLAGAAGCMAAGGCRSLDRFLEGGAGVVPRSGRNMAGFRTAPLPEVRVGVIGVGQRGAGHVKTLSRIPGVRIVAVSDLYDKRTAKAAKLLSDAGLPAPREYYGSDDAWRAVCERPDVDLVYICTPWLLHATMAVYAMECGKHAVSEVPAAVTEEECWQLVDTAEKTRRHFMMLENCCYGYNELLALSLCRKGVLGDLVHGAGAYLHDLSDSKLTPEEAGGYQGRWRLEWTKQHTGNPYPTHGLGPICQYMNINRGDRLEFLTSVSTDVFRMPQKAAEAFGEKAPEARPAYYRQGDMNTTVIRTYRGRTILLEHDTTSPEPYSRVNLIKGTRGIFRDYPLRVALEPSPHRWLDAQELDALKAKYEHPLWKKNGADAKQRGGRGWMDYLMNLRLVHCLRNGLPLDMDVYDAATWSCLVELTERSVLRNGRPQEIPDFTRGGWKTAEPLGIVNV